MGMSKKFLALAVLVCALAGASVTIAAGAAATATPTRPKLGKTVELKVTGLKPGERIKARELIADGGQTRTLYPRQRASAGGAIVVTVRAQIKGRHTWTFTGRTSHRKATTSYVVK
ncbi:MAG TPA: hypothetical protein VE570_07410 [Thermoleophilaceae bacterium]|jgi:hypothetical protein|nr:hypothetical protein [Thermoleophilaceae bacterium]